MTKTTTSMKKKKSYSNPSLPKRAFALLQKMGKSLLFPIAMLPIAAIFLRLGAALPKDTEFSAFVGGIVDAIGNAVFGFALPFLFAIGIAFGMSKDQRGEAAIVGFAVMVLLTALLSANIPATYAGKPVVTNSITKTAPVSLAGLDFVNKIYHGMTLNGGPGFHGIFGGAYNSILANNVFLGIFAGAMTAFIYNRFNGIEMPSVLGFFSGRRLVPVLAILSLTLLGLVWAMIFPWIGVGLFYMGKGMGTAQGNRFANAGIMGAYGFVNRMLIPFGLHHTINIPLWFTEVGGTFAGKSGDINIFAQAPAVTAAGVNPAGTFQSGFFPVMMFGLPAMALAFYYTAKNKTQKARVASLFAGSALVSFFTGITEPIEFTFMFLAPQLYVFHAILTGFSGIIVGLMGIQVGFGFSAGLIDYVLSIPKSIEIANAKGGADAVLSNPAWLVPIGIGTGAAYFFGSKFMIKKFNISTPGRGENLLQAESEEKIVNVAKGETKYTADAKAILKAVGGKSNVKSLGNCATRLRFVLKDNTKVDKAAIGKTKAMGSMKVTGGYQVIMGPTVEMYANEIQSLMN